MLQEIKHFVYHARVLKHKYRIIPRIISGYAKTIILKKNVLRTVEFALVCECNSRCIMCYASKTKREDDEYLTVKEYSSIWRQARSLGAFSAILSGGEPTLRKDLFDIISVMDPKHTVFALVTNSLNLSKSFLMDLKKAGLGTIHFSLDGVCGEENDRIRGVSGHFRKVMESVEEAKRIGLSVYLSTVIMHNGLKKMREMVKFAVKNNIGIVFSLACVSGNWADEGGVLLTGQEWQDIRDFMKSNPFIRSDWTINFSLRQECPGGREKISISSYGEAMGCGMNYVSFGNVRQEPLKTIWRRMGNFPDFKRRSADCLIGADREYIRKFIQPLSGLVVPIRVDRHPTNPITLKELDLME